MPELDHVQFGELHALTGGSGKPLVFLHGFPDCPATAVPFLEELIARGFRVLAPWLRGYSPSPLAGPFDLATLAADVRALAAAWTDEPVCLVGHDWGAAITYAVCQEMPVPKAVTLAVPPPHVMLRQLRTPRQAAHSWYMAFFQLPGVGRLVGPRFIDHLWRAWSPGFRLPEPRRAALHACMTASLPAPLEYYRAFARTLFDRDFQRALRTRTNTPILALHGADDGCILPPRGSEIVPNVGHFLHLEAPSTIAERVATWMS